MTKDGSGTTYTFDDGGRLTLASGPSGGPYCYVYDGNGLRVAKKASASSCASGTVTKLYWRSISGDALAETDSSGSTTNSAYNEYVFFTGRRIASRNGTGSIFYYFADQVGTTRTITTGNGPGQTAGQLCYDADFTPYGQEIQYTARLQTTACAPNYRFTGYEYDSETGLNFAFARYYSPRLGRFLSTDPLGGSIGDLQSHNAYAYVVNNPLNFIDPTGQYLAGPKGTLGSSNPGGNPFDPLSGGVLYPVFGPGTDESPSVIIGYVYDFGSGLGVYNIGNGGGGANKDINKIWKKTFKCNKSAQSVMSAVQNNMSQFANNRGLLFGANFPDQPIAMGSHYTIQAGVNAGIGVTSGIGMGLDTYPLVFASQLAVTVTSQSTNSWTFTTNPSQYYFDGTVTFSSTDAGDGSVAFSITANADWASSLTEYTIGPLILAGENSTWQNMLNNVQNFCSAAGN